MELSLEERVYGLSLIWKEAEYNFPFWKRLKGLDWDKAYREALPKVTAASDMREYYLELSRFISLLRDGHTDLQFPHEVIQDAGQLPVVLRMIDGTWYVMNADVSTGIPIYDELFSIQGMLAAEYVSANIYPYCWHEKPDSAAWQVNMLLPLIEYKRAIALQTASGSYSVRASEAPVQWQKMKKAEGKETLTELVSAETHRIRVTQDGIAVISVPDFVHDTLGSEFYAGMSCIRDCRGYIVDVRGNCGGNSDNADCLAQAFLKGEFICSTEQKMVHIGTYKAWGKFTDLEQLDRTKADLKKMYDICKRQYFEYNTEKKKVEECPFTLEGPLVVLEDAGTVSAAEDFLLDLDVAGRATIVGTPSYGSTGQPLIFDLPGGGVGRICTHWCTYPDGKEFINVGVLPHVQASCSVEDWRNGYDRVLDTALAVLREKIG